MGDLVPVPDSAQPVIDAGFIDDSGKWRVAAASNDSSFTFQDPNQALAAGASLFIDPLNMLNHDKLILGLLDSSGNAISVDTIYVGNAAVQEGPYADTAFTDTGVSATVWRVNEYPGSAQPAAGLFDNIMDDSGQTLTTTWKFYKIIGLLGTVGQMQIRSNEATDAGTISTAYLRIA